MGVVESLSAGYRLLGRRVELLLVPLLLDILLWLTPGLNIEPVVSRLAQFYAQAGAAAQLPPGGISIAQMTTDMQAMGASTNLLTGLVSGVFLHVPSLMTTAVLPSATRSIPIESSWAALGIWVGCILVGVWLGVVYMEMLARVLPLGAAAKPVTWGEMLRRSLRHWVRVLGFMVMLMLAMILLLIPYSMMLAVTLFVAPGLFNGLTVLSVGFVFVILLYFYFVTPAIILDDLRIREALFVSLKLVRTYFFSVLALVVLMLVISAGLGLLLARVAAWQPWGTLAAILANAYIGTGLAMALLVFYRSRLILAVQPAESSA